MLADYPILEYDPDPIGIIDPAMVSRRDVPECAVLCFFNEVVTKLSADARECFKLRTEHGTHVAYEIEHERQAGGLLPAGCGRPTCSRLPRTGDCARLSAFRSLWRGGRIVAP